MRISIRSRAGAPVLAAAIAALGCSSGDLKGPEAEVHETSVDLQLPPVPDFDVPRPNADGSHPVREMRLQGNRYLGSDVRVQGYVTWVYDCATAIRTAEMSEDDLQRIIREEPERCDRPNIYLGDAPDAQTDKGIWVVEVPRQPREDELGTGAYPPEMVDEIIDRFVNMPPFEVGDQVEVTGRWDLTSPTGFRNSDGLLTYSSMKNLSKPEAGEEKRAALDATVKRWRKMVKR